MEKNSRTEMLPGKRDLYRCCKARRSASHVNKEFWQFQNYAPPSLRVIRTKFARTIIYNNTVKRRLSERQLSETSINRTLKETARACPSAIFCMFTIAASTVPNVRRLWNVRMAEKPMKEEQNGEKKLRFVSIGEVELPLLFFQKILRRQIRYHE